MHNCRVHTTQEETKTRRHRGAELELGNVRKEDEGRTIEGIEMRRGGMKEK
jgi:hypothetical protein